MSVRDGDKVKAGEMLLERWDRDLMVEISVIETESYVATAAVSAACLQSEVATREARRLLCQKPLWAER